MCICTAYLLNNPIDDQWILQDVLTDARVEHDPCKRQDKDTEKWAYVMLIIKAIYGKIITLLIPAINKLFFLGIDLIFPQQVSHKMYVYVESKLFLYSLS